jgi:hypothetical protein
MICTCGAGRYTSGMTPLRELLGFLVEASESPRKFLAFVGLLAGLGLLRQGIVVAQKSLTPHWQTLAYLGGGFIVGSVSALCLYWLRVSESQTKDAEEIAVEAMAKQAAPSHGPQTTPAAAEHVTPAKPDRT